MARHLISLGDAHSGGSDRDAIGVANEWIDYFDGDLDTAKRWPSAGWWNPAAANDARAIGYDPEDIPETTTEEDDPVYALNNGDTNFAHRR
jgi:hypothetical protein